MDGSVGFPNTHEMDRNLSDSTQLSPKGEVNSGGNRARRKASRYISSAVYQP